MKEFAVYTLARVGLFVATWAVLAGLAQLVLGSPYWLITLLLAAVVSAVASLYLLRGPRERFASSVQRRAERMTEALERSRSKEDED